MSLKPPKYVDTVRRLIYWQYAQLIAKAAGFEGNYGFVISRYKKLESGEMARSSSIRDYEKELDKGRVCIYCGASENLSTDHIVPISRAGVDPRIGAILDSADNCVCACKRCNSSKGDRDVFEWYGAERLDEVPKLVLSKFLKLAYRMHEMQGTLDLKDPNMDGVLDIYDLGVVITHLITKISEKAGTGEGPPHLRPKDSAA
ncbi:HNH endonuclease [Candidatus Bipolaricaulota bacterium]|nr:HNH endonuclease [Candidatus Bipolaricaulota bacterium]